MGGLGTGLFKLIEQLIYLWAFGVAIIQASNAWRGRKGSFDEAWDEGRSKFGGILWAAVGFQFIMWAAGMIGGMIPFFGLLLVAVAAFFLIYTMPAAAIGGMPGQLAISASIRGVRTNPAAAAVLAIVFVILWVGVPTLGLGYLFFWLQASQFVQQIVTALVQALILGYLAFPFAKQYDDVAFSRFW
jgi:hypothetical protein